MACVGFNYYYCVGHKKRNVRLTVTNEFWQRLIILLCITGARGVDGLLYTGK